MRNSTDLPEPKAKRLEPLWALLAFCALAVYWTWPVAATLGSRIPHDPGDPVLNIWFLWWNAQVTPLTDAWWNAPMMWPMPGSMALSEHLLGLSLVATPLQLAGVNAIAAYNICLLLTYALSGFFAFLLGRRLTGSTFAGVCAGLAFGFSPYRASQLAHIQVLSSQWMPLALLGLHAYVASGARRWLVVFGAAWLLQALSNGYFLLFFPVLVAAWLAWFVDWRKAPGRGLAIVTAWVIASLPLLPVLLKYHEVHQRLGLTRKVAEIREFSAIPASFFHAAPLMRFWREGPAENYEQYLVHGRDRRPAGARRARAVLHPENARAGQRRPRTNPFLRSRRRFSCGCSRSARGAKDTNRRRSPVPIAGCSRCRVSMACGCRRASRWSARCASRWRQVSPSRSCRGSWSFAGRWRALAGAAVIAGLAVDGMTRPVPVVPPPGKVILPGSPQAAVMELPIDNIDIGIGAMYRSMFHRQPLVNGYSGHFPPHYIVLSLSLWRGDVSGLFYLARRRPLVILVSDRLDSSRSFKEMIEGVPGIQNYGVSGAGTMFLLPAQAAPRDPPSGPALPASVRDAGRYVLEFDVGAPRELSGVSFPLRKRYEDLAPRIRIETSEDGQTWRESWLGWTGGMAVEATLADRATGADADPARRRQGALRACVSGVNVDEDRADVRE